LTVSERSEPIEHAQRDTQLLRVPDGPWMADRWQVARPRRLDTDGTLTCAVACCDRPAGGAKGDIPKPSDVLCLAHRRRFSKISPLPALDHFIEQQAFRPILRARGANTRTEIYPTVDFTRVHPRVAHELRYVTAYKVSQRRWNNSEYVSSALRGILLFAERLGLTSLLDMSYEEMRDKFREVLGDDFVRNAMDALPSTIRIISQAHPDAWSSDRWDRHALGLPAGNKGGRQVVTWSAVTCPWLKVALKRHCRVLLQSGQRSFGTIETYLRGARLLSRYMSEESGPLEPAELSRTVYLDFVAWVGCESDARRPDLNAVNTLASVLVALRADGHVPDLPDTTFLLRGENPIRKARNPRPFPVDVVAAIDRMLSSDLELEDDVRLMLKLFRAVGPRAAEALHMPLDALRHLESRGYSLEYFMTKVDEWRLVPLPLSLGEELSRQTARVVELHGPDCPWLFPYSKPTRRSNTLMHGVEGVPVPWSYKTFQHVVWGHYQRNGITQSSITGERLTRPQLHRFRHTVATDMLRNGWDTHEVKHFLGHKSATMVEACAEITDEAVALKYEEFVRDVVGDTTAIDLGSTARVEFLRDKMIRTALPNGYCTLPDKLSCDVIPSPCLTCSFFKTTPVFLPVHIRQRDEAKRLLGDARAAGRSRVAEGYEKKLSELDRIIGDLETLESRTVVVESS